MKHYFIITALVALISPTSLLSQATWSGQTLPEDVYSLKSVCFVDDQHGWAVGLEAFTTPSAIVHTNDGGTTWVKQTTSALWTLNDVHFINSATGWIVGDYGVILHTSDGGNTWEEQTNGTETSQNLKSVYFHDSESGWAVGGAGSGEPGVILRTADGGASWTSQSSGLTGTVTLKDIHFYNSIHGWILGLNGEISHTEDAGSNWSSHEIDTDVSMTAIHFSSPGTGWVSGYSGKIFHSNSGGNTWTEQSTPHDGFLDDIFFTSSTNGWAIGSSGSVLSTTDAGSTWEMESISGFGTRLYGISFTSENNGWVVGAGSGSGEVHKFAEGSTGILSIGDQNSVKVFPNPLSTSSIIEFELTGSGKTTLKVFDALGKEVAVLLDETVSAGVHRIPFDAENLSEGLYNYHLQTEGRIITGKMMKN